jgi:hypothetical protein
MHSGKYAAEKFLTKAAGERLGIEGTNCQVYEREKECVGVVSA